MEPEWVKVEKELKRELAYGNSDSIDQKRVELVKALQKDEE